MPSYNYFISAATPGLSQPESQHDSLGVAKSRAGERLAGNLERESERERAGSMADNSVQISPDWLTECSDNSTPRSRPFHPIPSHPSPCRPHHFIPCYMHTPFPIPGHNVRLQKVFEQGAYLEYCYPKCGRQTPDLMGPHGHRWYHVPSLGSFCFFRYLGDWEGLSHKSFKCMGLKNVKCQIDYILSEGFFEKFSLYFEPFHRNISENIIYSSRILILFFNSYHIFGDFVWLLWIVCRLSFNCCSPQKDWLNLAKLINSLGSFRCGSTLWFCARVRLFLGRGAMAIVHFWLPPSKTNLSLSSHLISAKCGRSCETNVALGPFPMPF